MTTNKNKKNRGLLLAAGLAVFGYLGYRYLFPAKEAEVFQVTGGAGTVNLALIPASSTQSANTTRDLDLTIDTDGATVSAVQVELAYLPSKCVTPITVTKGDFLTVVLAAPRVTNNKIKFTYGAEPVSHGKNGSGILAKVTTGPTTGPCVISFTANTIAAAINSNKNEIASAADAVINPIAPTPGPSPSLAPSPSVIPSPSPSRYNEVIQKYIDRYGSTQVCRVANKYHIPNSVCP